LVSVLALLTWVLVRALVGRRVRALVLLAAPLERFDAARAGVFRVGEEVVSAVAIRVVSPVRLAKEASTYVLVSKYTLEHQFVHPYGAIVTSGVHKPEKDL
jgi:hypothetical protein